MISGHAVTVAEAILRQWATSKNPVLQKAFIEIAFGKVPDNLDITSHGEAVQIGVIGVDYRVAIAPITPRPMADSIAPGEDKSSGNGSKVG